MKNLILATCIATLVFGCKEKTKENTEEKTSDEVTVMEVETSEAEWVTLFDGTSFDGWHEYLTESVSDNWKIEDGAMVLYPPKDRKDGEHFNIISDKEYTDFELSMEWRIAEAGNSGIFWGIQELPELTEPYHSGPEIQVLDNDKHPDGKNGTSHQSGALYDLVSPSKDVTKPIGEWNLCIISINHKTNEGSVMLNGEKMVDFPVNDPEWSALISGSKFDGWEHFGTHASGKVGMQDHGDGVAFRNIKIKEL